MRQARQHEILTTGLVMSSASSAVGLIAFCIVALVATDLALLPNAARLALVLVGGFFVAIGAEGGSLFSIVEAFRIDGKIHATEFAGAIVSQLATITTVVFAFATLTGASSRWAMFVAEWGYIVNTLLVSIDATFNYVALGKHLANLEKQRIHDMRTGLWFEQQRIQIERQRFALVAQQEQYRHETGTKPMEPVSQHDETPAKLRRNSGETKRANDETAKQCIARLFRDGETSVQRIAQQCECSAQYARKLRKQLGV
jgi:hypothetical protein